MADNLMRVESKQPKISTDVAIPVRLLEFFQDVDRLIEQQDELTTIESDDLIQTEFVYGGLIEEGSDRFGFTYFPKEDTRPAWTLDLSASEIADISRGKKKTLVLWGCQNPDCQSLFSSENDACSDCDYVDDELAAKKMVLDSLSQSQTREVAMLLARLRFKLPWETGFNEEFVLDQPLLFHDNLKLARVGNLLRSINLEDPT